MTLEDKTDALIKEIVEGVNDLVPTDWNDLYFFSDVSKYGGAVYFYYSETNNSGQYIDGMDIPEIRVVLVCNI
ncbi:immunity protein YezG family protein [Loigolactobacillus binensis]|uniref:Immunity protein YezG family protein n=1 Tax=Loigolactobacillus binensis TaxID=2559922 RepID=A0ABW3EEU0_9LACO|nr:immunity protein YezG family protein [Loigolactobacillus binensis]